MDTASLDGSITCRLWIFGYGSLCWRPGFKYDRAVTGHIKGYARKFWQGNTTHRGTTDKPGRVATLIENDRDTVWGCAYEISGETAIPYLTNRECKLGGYMTKFVMFYPKEPDVSTARVVEPFTVMLYIATPKNDLWLGDAPLHEIATQITECSGESGHNVEYVIRLAEFMRDHIPGVVDDHLFTLEYLVRARIKQNNMSIKTFMGNGEGLRTFERLNGSRNPSPERDAQHDAAVERVDSFQYTARIPEKNLRCLNI